MCKATAIAIQTVYQNVHVQLQLKFNDVAFVKLGIFLSLRGTPIDNDSFVDVDDIGNADNALLCLTNATNCCSAQTGGGVALGNWWFPDGTSLPTIASLGGSTSFSRNRGQSVVRLHRQNNPPERGRFMCGLPWDIIYVNICE